MGATAPALAQDAGVLDAQGKVIFGTEGAPISGDVATFTDDDPSALASDFTVMIDWGDGAHGPGTVTGSTGAFTVGGTHTYADEGSFSVAVSIGAANGATAMATGTAHVNDASLTAIGRPVTATVGVPFSGDVMDFHDLNPGGTLADFTASIDWGDGVVSTGTVLAGTPSGLSVNGTHTYTSVGSFSVVSSVLDVGGVGATVVGTATVSSPVGLEDAVFDLAVPDLEPPDLATPDLGPAVEAGGGCGCELGAASTGGAAGLLLALGLAALGIALARNKRT